MRAFAAALAASLALSACRRSEAPKEGDAGPVAAFRLPLPEGWTASAQERDAIAAGPRGRPVLRIQRAPGRGLPRLSELRAAFSGELEGIPLETISEEEAADRIGWRARAGPSSDGGRAAEVFLGARAVGGEAFWCASLPGASAEEVDQAARACASLGD